MIGDAKMTMLLYADLSPDEQRKLEALDKGALKNNLDKQ